MTIYQEPVLSPYDRINELLARFTYKPGFKAYAEHNDFVCELVIEMQVPEARWRGIGPTPMTKVMGRRIPPPESLDYDMEDAFYEWLRREIRDLEWHELDEWFRVDGHLMFDPHRGE